MRCGIRTGSQPWHLQPRNTDSESKHSLKHQQVRGTTHPKNQTCRCPTVSVGLTHHGVWDINTQVIVAALQMPPNWIWIWQFQSAQAGRNENKHDLRLNMPYHITKKCGTVVWLITCTISCRIRIVARNGMGPCHRRASHISTLPCPSNLSPAVLSAWKEDQKRKKTGRIKEEHDRRW